MNLWHNDLKTVLPLDGEWEFSLDGQQGMIQVPGTWEAQGYPRRVDGPAVYERRVNIPAAWQGQQVQLQFDAVSYHIEAEVNGMSVGSHRGMWAPFAFDVTAAAHPGEENLIRLTVYKPGDAFPVREALAGFLPDVCLPFGGLWQSTRLVAFQGVGISDLSLLADAATGTINIGAALHHAAGLTAVARIYAPDGREVTNWRGTVEGDALSAHLQVVPVQRWSPGQPALYTAEIVLYDATERPVARVERSFGFRTLARLGEQLLLNDRPVFLRGVLNWGWYPEILCPAPDAATIRDEFRRVRAAGYNMVKLCLYVPSPLYFEIADEEGILLWLELPLWLPQVTPQLRAQAPREYAAILAAVQQHPSIVIYSLGCELGAAVDADLLGELNAVLRSKTSGVLVCDNSGSGEAYGGLAFDYADFNDYHFYCDLHYFNPLLDHFRRDWRPARPWIFGEFCDADDYRDLDEIAAAYEGVLPWWLVEQNPIHALSAIGYSQQAKRMAALDLPFSGQDLQRISRQQSLMVRKTILEKVRAKAGMGGYVVTGLRDTPLATSSMFDDLGRAKYPAEIFRDFNADAVLILEQGRRRVWQHGGDRPAPTDRLTHVAGTTADFRVVLASAGEDMPAGVLQWQLVDAHGQCIQQGACAFPGGTAGSTPREIASFQVHLPALDTAQQWMLRAEVSGQLRNQWPLWVYPNLRWPEGLALYDPTGSLGYLDDLAQAAGRINTPAKPDRPDHHILLTSVFTPELYDYIKQGGRAILLQAGAGSFPARPCPFWREAVKLLYTHPVLAGFPHQGYVDLQFYHLASDYALDLYEIEAVLPDVTQVRPIIRRLDARQFTLLDYLAELHIGAGTLLASTLRFGGGMGDQVNGLQANPAGRHLLHAMLSALLPEAAS